MCRWSWSWRRGKVPHAKANHGELCSLMVYKRLLLGCHWLGFMFRESCVGVNLLNENVLGKVQSNLVKWKGPFCKENKLLKPYDYR